MDLIMIALCKTTKFWNKRGKISCNDCVPYPDGGHPICNKKNMSSELSLPALESISRLAPCLSMDNMMRVLPWAQARFWQGELLYGSSTVCVCLETMKMLRSNNIEPCPGDLIWLIPSTHPRELTRHLLTHGAEQSRMKRLASY